MHTENRSDRPAEDASNSVSIPDAQVPFHPEEIKILPSEPIVAYHFRVLNNFIHKFQVGTNPIDVTAQGGSPLGMNRFMIESMGMWDCFLTPDATLKVFHSELRLSMTYRQYFDRLDAMVIESKRDIEELSSLINTVLFGPGKSEPGRQDSKTWYEVTQALLEVYIMLRDEGFSRYDLIN